MLDLINEELGGEPEKAVAPHSSALAWKIPWTEEPGGLQFMGSLRVRHDGATSLSLFTFMHWRRKWHPTPVFLPGESQGWGSLVAAVYGVAQSRTQLKRLCSRGGTWEPLYTRPLCVSRCHNGGEPTSQCTRHRGAGSIPGSGRSPAGGNGNHSSILAWRIPWTVEPGGPQSMDSRRAGHDSTEQPSVSRELCLSAHSVILKNKTKHVGWYYDPYFFILGNWAFLSNSWPGTSLMVQWLRFHLPGGVIWERSVDTYTSPYVE